MAINISDEIRINFRRIFLRSLRMLKQRGMLLEQNRTARKPLPSTTAKATSATSSSPLSEKTLYHLTTINSSQEVRKCHLHEYKAIALSLARSFADDPVAMHFINTTDAVNWTPAQKWTAHLAAMEAVVYAHLLDGVVTTIGDDYGAVALWLPPGRNADSFATNIRSGTWALRFRLPSLGSKRFFKDFMPLLHDTKSRVMGDRDDDSWYLVYLGTRPEARRMGYARALLEDVMLQADVDGKACYLESSKAMNVSIYEKFGFQYSERVWMQGEHGKADGVPLDIMVREPKIE